MFIIQSFYRFIKYIFEIDYFVLEEEEDFSEREPMEINVPNDACQDCGYTDEINEKCYDVIVLGTGLKESILASLLAKYPESIANDAKKGVKILQLDRNNYIGSESTSFNLTNLWSHFSREKEVPKYYGPDKDWNVDLIPKFIMASGTLVKIILKTKASQYIEWKSIDGIFMYKFSVFFTMIALVAVYSCVIYSPKLLMILFNPLSTCISFFVRGCLQFWIMFFMPLRIVVSFSFFTL